MAFNWFRGRGKSQARVESLQHKSMWLEGVGQIYVARTIECLRQNCPRPQILMMKAINEAADGDIVELICDNPSAVESIPALALVLYSTHLGTEKEDGFWRLYVRKGV